MDVAFILQWVQVLTIIFGVIFGVGGVVWWINSITNKRIDDINSRIDGTNRRIDSTNQSIEKLGINTTKAIKEQGEHLENLFDAKLEAKITPLQYQVSNHIPSQIAKLEKETKERYERLEKEGKERDKKLDKILDILEKDRKNNKVS